MKNLKEIRQKRHMTQEQVAKALKVSHATYWGYETGKYEPNIDLLKALSNLFKVSIDYIVGNENNYVIELADISQMKKELLIDILKLDDFDCYDKWKELKERKEWEEENPQEAEEIRHRKLEQRDIEIEHFKRLVERSKKR